MLPPNWNPNSGTPCPTQGKMTTLRKLLLTGNPMRTLRRYVLSLFLLLFCKLVVRNLCWAAINVLFPVQLFLDQPLHYWSTCAVGFHLRRKVTKKLKSTSMHFIFNGNILCCRLFGACNILNCLDLWTISRPLKRSLDIFLCSFRIWKHKHPNKRWSNCCSKATVLVFKSALQLFCRHICDTIRYLFFFFFSSS